MSEYQKQPPPYGMHNPPPSVPPYGPPPNVPPHLLQPQGPPPLSQPRLLVQGQFGPAPSSSICPSCNIPVMTRVEHESTAKTHLFALLLCIVFFPCVCLPYCMDSCQATNHYCPNCGAYLGTYDH
ncbi:lipopolysaccharide-induced tumor necrosis factor-alpha factor homolog [Lycorma delicatula]|uniref:lipopolysaccharide-induced tumor necrosis factor-alpha factor homolog n=1 Tax=Lycorma delicatula TaxID=130591 RepID=UPI003F5178A0